MSAGEEWVGRMDGCNVDRCCADSRCNQDPDVYHFILSVISADVSESAAKI